MFDFEDIYLEGYYDAIKYINFLNEGSSVAKYLNHHSIGGTLFGPSLFRWFNSELKKGDSFMGVAKLYPKYHQYCLKRGYSPLPKGEFIKEGKKYYEMKGKVDLGQFGGEVGGNIITGIGNAATTGALVSGSAGAANLGAAAGLGGIGYALNRASAIGSEAYRRSSKFVDKTKMKHDID